MFRLTRPTLSQLVDGRRGVVQLPGLIKDPSDNEYLVKNLKQVLYNPITLYYVVF